MDFFSVSGLAEVLFWTSTSVFCLVFPLTAVLVPAVFLAFHVLLETSHEPDEQARSALADAYRTHTVSHHLCSPLMLRVIVTIAAASLLDYYLQGSSDRRRRSDKTAPSPRSRVRSLLNRPFIAVFQRWSEWRVSRRIVERNAHRQVSNDFFFSEETDAIGFPAHQPLKVFDNSADTGGTADDIGSEAEEEEVEGQYYEADDSDDDDDDDDDGGGGGYGDAGEPVASMGRQGVDVAESDSDDEVELLKVVCPRPSQGDND
jgi:hypothetical protein